MPVASRPVYRVLDRDGMDAILARNHVGRIAYSFHDDVNIEPIHYVYADGVLHARTSPGHKLRTLEHHRWVAFEVDEVDGLSDWRSVVVHGAIYPAESGLTPSGQNAYERTVARLHELVPAIFADDDPAPHRRALFRIHVDRMTGRAASTQ